MLHFVEFPTDSACYLINNNLQKTDGSQEINGITSKDLEVIKYKFSKYEKGLIFKLNYSLPVPYKIPYPPFDYKPTSNTVIKQYTKLDFQITFNTLFTTTEVLKNRPNALYGYMAWNLGNIKVFCPQQVEFTDNSEKNKQSAKQCLLIDGKYLQILDDQYITSD